MHTLLRLPYALLAGLATAAVRLPVRGEGKFARALISRRDVSARARLWAEAARDPRRPLLWVHAPSVGEGLQARPVIELLRREHPDWQFAYSWFSPSAERFAQGIHADFATCLPFDTAGAARALLDALRPSALIFAKLDLWPVLAQEAKRRGVALGMISATLSPTSRRSGALARAVLGDAYGALDAVGAIDPADAERLTRLGVAPERVRVTGDTRYDQVAARAATVAGSSPLLARLTAARPTLVAGSTWPADEEALLPAWEQVRAQVAGARLVIAPHEPGATHLAQIERWASRAGVRLARLDDATAESEVVLVDRVVVLGELYALASAAFVGGGFHAAGLHSVLEPAAFGVPVAFGPRHQGSRDAGLLLAAKGGASCDDPASLAALLTQWLGDRASREAAGSAARGVVQSGLGAAARSARLVEELVTRR